MTTEVREAGAAPAPMPLFMVTEDMIESRDWSRGQTPVFRVSQVAKVFFGMSDSWLRLKIRPDEAHPQTWFTYEDGTRIDFRRKDPSRTDSERVFLLSDIEPMAWSLFRLEAIDTLRLGKILRIVQAVAVLYDLIPLDAPEGEPLR